MEGESRENRGNIYETGADFYVKVSVWMERCSLPHQTYYLNDGEKTASHRARNV